MINFKKKNILITGGTGGIGKAIVKKFVSLEGNVLATGTKVENLENLKKEFPTVKILKFDISDHDKIEEFIENANSELNLTNILITDSPVVSKQEGFLILSRNISRLELVSDH